MSRRRYAVRRVGAVLVLVALVLGAVRLVGALVGDGTVSGAADGTATDEASTPEAVTTPDGAGAPGGATGTGDLADPATTVAPTSPPTTAGPIIPSAATPATLLIVGDSDAGTFGPYLQRLMDDTGMVETTLDYKVSSGLSRPDFFDWPAHLRTTVPEVAPHIVVATFGGNDAQGLALLDGTFPIGQPTGEPGGDVEWRAEYGRRVGEVMDYLSADGRTLVWVGIPNDDDEQNTQRFRVQNEVVVAEAAKRPDVVFIDTWSRFSGRDGGWAEYVIDPRDGVGKDVRAADGFHLNENGAEILALDIATAVRDELRARGADLPD